MNHRPICFDMDGVIVDSEPSHFEAFRQTFQPLGIRLTDEQYQLFFAGKTDEQGFVDFLAHIERPLGIKTLQAIKRHNYQKLVETTVEPYPTTVMTISQLAIKHPLALVTSSPESQVSAILDRFGLQEHFSVLVTAESVINGKPDPESYLLAAEMLGRPAADCIAVEDAPSGISAAKRAGMYCVALTTTHSADRLGQADRVVEKLSAELFARL
jgi:HAD superfamily hydrolase (TIGR01509 family)